MRRGEAPRIPTLLEVLDQRTAPPVDLRAFYDFVQCHNEEDALDFWLDVREYERMCAVYQYLDGCHEPVPQTGAWRGNGNARDFSYVHISQKASEEARETNITLFDLVASAQRIYEHYLIPCAEHEILLPPALRKEMAWSSEMHAMTGNVNELMELFQHPRKYV